MTVNSSVRIRQTGYDRRYNTWHTLNRNMILFVHSGSGSIVDRERSYPIVPGCLCFVGSDRFYYTLPDVEEDYVRSKLFLTDEELETVLRFFSEELGMQTRFTHNTIVYARLDPVRAAKAEDSFAELQRYEKQSGYHRALVTGTFIRLLVELHEEAAVPMFAGAGMVQRAVNYINSHIGEEVRLEEICREVHVSKGYFCKKFKTATGMTPMEYLLKTRIITAQNLLENRELSMGEISACCGFSSQSYFCRVFRENAGMTPLQYRKKLVRN